MTPENNPSTRSADVAAMAEQWKKVDVILDGIDAVRRNKGTFLPKMDAETDGRYNNRVAWAKMTNLYGDIVEDLASRPFADKLVLKDEPAPPPDFEELVEDIDGQGNNLHVFGGESFYCAVAYGLDIIVIDYTSNIPPAATVADEKRLGARPYWCRYPARNLISYQTAMINGREEPVHVRLLEYKTQKAGFKEDTKTRIRIFDREEIEGKYGRPTVEVWEKVSDNGAEEWRVETPKTPMTIDEIPVVIYGLGRKVGSGWKNRPPMQQALELQCKLIEQETDLEFAKKMTAYPMIAGNGVEAPIGDDGKVQPIVTGPGVVLFTGRNSEGSQGKFETLEITAASLKFLADEIAVTKKDLRELGRQPLTLDSGTITRITSAVAAEKGNSAIQNWALLAADAFDRAMAITAKYLRSSTAPVVNLDPNFDLSIREDDGFDHVLSLRKSGEISRDATIHEAKRRSILDRDYDADADAEKLLDDLETDDLSDDEDDEEPDDIE